MNFDDYLNESHWKSSSHYDMSQRGSKPDAKYKHGSRQSPAGDEKDHVAAPLTTSKSYTYKKHFYKVPYTEKHVAKERGMKWDAGEKHWYYSSKDYRDGKHKDMPTHWEYSHTKQLDTSF